jgi:hypothetical protein
MYKSAKDVRIKTLINDTSFNLKALGYVEGDTESKITIEELKKQLMQRKDHTIEFQKSKVYLKSDGCYLTGGPAIWECQMIYDKPCPLEKQYGLNGIKLKNVYYCDVAQQEYRGHKVYIVSRVIFSILNKKTRKVDKLEMYCPELYRNLLVMDTESNFAKRSGLSTLSFVNRTIRIADLSKIRNQGISIEEDPLMIAWKNKMTLNLSIDNFGIRDGELFKYSGKDKSLTLPPVIGIWLDAFEKSPVEQVKLPKTFITEKEFEKVYNKNLKPVKVDYENVDFIYDPSDYTELQLLLIKAREFDGKVIRNSSKDKICDLDE